MKPSRNFIEVPGEPNFYISNEEPLGIYLAVVREDSDDYDMVLHSPIKRNIVMGDDLYQFPCIGDISLSRLIVNTFYGEVNFPIFVNDPKKGPRSYVYLMPKYEQVDENTLKFNTVVPGEYAIFKRIPNYSDYFITENGVVYSRRQSTIMRWSINKDHQWVICPTRDDGAKAPCRVDRLIYAAHVYPEMSSTDYIMHRDKLWYNVKLSNLYITTQEELRQYQDEERAKKQAGVKRSYERLDNQKVHIICEMLVDRKSNAEIAENIGVDYATNAPRINTTIYNILHGRIFRGISGQYDLKSVIESGERRYAPKKKKDEVKEDEHDSE